MRSDISNKLVHLTKGVGTDVDKHRTEAFRALGSIMSSKSLRGGYGFIKGLNKCVCFSEAPISMFSQILSMKAGSGFKYQPYGVIVDKRWLYSKGGRPVIYGPGSDFHKLPEEMRFRHVRFELDRDPTIDHTDERE